MKKNRLLLLLFLLPVSLFAQQVSPDNFSGTIIYEKNRNIEYTYLNNPPYGTSFSCFDKIPTEKEYTAGLKKKLVPFEEISIVEFKRFTSNEADSVKMRCPGCSLKKAKFTFKKSHPGFPEYVYVALTQVEWKSTTMKGYEDLRTMEARFLNKIAIQVKKR